jgi:hypothetical protein
MLALSNFLSFLSPSEFFATFFYPILIKYCN